MSALNGRRLIAIGGAEKAGTTSLHRSLARSPSLASHDSHEFSHFVNDHEYQLPIDASFDRYRIFPEPGQDVLIKSVGILHRPGAAERLASIWQPDWLLAVQLRHPTDRALSAARYRRQTGRETRPLAVALDLDAPGPNEYLRRGDYEPDLRRLFDLFGRHRVIIRTLEGDGLDPTAIEALADQLGIKAPARPDGARTVEARANVTEAPGPFARLRPAARLVPRSIVHRIPDPVQRRFWERLTAIGRRPRPIAEPDPSHRFAIDVRFQEPIARLEELLGRELTEWTR